MFLGLGSALVPLGSDMGTAQKSSFGKRLSEIQLGSELGSTWFRLVEINVAICRMTQFLQPTCVFFGAWFRLGSTWVRHGHASRHGAEVTIRYKASSNSICLVPLGSDIGPQFLQARKRYVPQVRDSLCPLPHKSGHSPGPRLRSPGGYLYSV